METIQIDLSESLNDFVRSRVAEGGFENAGAYLRELIRADRERRAEARVDALLLEGLDSGTPIAATPEFWAERKRRLAERSGGAAGPRPSSA